MQSVYISKIIKVGGSHSVLIPKEILNAYKWERGDMLIFGFLSNDQLFLKKLTDIEWQNLKPKDIIN